MNRTESPSTVRMSVTKVAAMIRLPVTDRLRPVSTSTAYTTARLVVESARPPISAWPRVHPAAQYALAIATTNGAANDTVPMARLARHSRLSWGTCTSVPARNVSTMPANDPMNESQSGIETVNAFPTATPAASSISATDRPSSIETVLASRIVAARTVASARSLTAPPPGS
jgi:hypothetical protein